MNKHVVEVRGLSKQYRLGATVSHNTLRDAIASGFKSIFGRKSETPRRTDNGTIWALKDVSFDVKEGEVLGIIGRNGAGKSTLLKVLSRITEPTEGEARIRGRVGSLLEVGTGFHPELTGRENIFLNGAILGMRKVEIKRKFDEIVEFAGIEKLLDTPVKRYSSGMYVRLAFAVAAHFEPEILVIDEVLAVGDAQFQKKCLGKMGDVAKGGRTVLFVSHNMGAVQRLCERAILLDDGVKVADNETEIVIGQYLTSGQELFSAMDFQNDPYKEWAQITAMRLVNGEGVISSSFDISEGLNIEIVYEIKKALKNHRLVIVLKTILGEVVFYSTSTDYSEDNIAAECGKYKANMKIPGKLLNTGEYLIGVGLDEPGISEYDRIEDAFKFSIEGLPWHVPWNKPGILSGNYEWTFSKLTGKKIND